MKLGVNDVQELDEIRKKIRNNDIFLIIVIFFTLILVIKSMSAKFLSLDFIGIIGLQLIVIEVLVMGFRIGKMKKVYRKLYKDKYVVGALNNVFDNLNYLPDKGISWNTIAMTGMMNMGDTYTSEDYVSGTYKNVGFTQSDVHIQRREEHVDSEGHRTTHYVTTFKGRWMIFEFNKKFKADVQISQKGFSNSRVGKLFAKKEERFKRVKLESETFNKKFNVFAQNEHDAFYIITPSLMSRLEKLVSGVRGKFLFCFVDNLLHIGLDNGKDSFEPPSVFKKFNEEEIISNVLSDIKPITTLIEELNLDNDLFRGEV